MTSSTACTSDKFFAVSGLFRRIENIHGEELKVISHALFTKGLNSNTALNRLNSTLEGNRKTMNAWLPP